LKKFQFKIRFTYSFIDITDKKDHNSDDNIIIENFPLSNKHCFIVSCPFIKLSKIPDGCEIMIVNSYRLTGEDNMVGSTLSSPVITAEERIVDDVVTRFLRVAEVHRQVTFERSPAIGLFTDQFIMIKNNGTYTIPVKQCFVASSSRFLCIDDMLYEL
jgi:hypothetical protein